MVEITIGGGGELQGAEADLVQRLVINAESLVRVFNKLMHGKGGVVGFDDGIGNLST